jgi:hypothetical protein
MANFSADDTGEKTWQREGRELRIVDISDLGGDVDAKESADEAEEEGLAELPETPSIDVGFNEEPDCDLIELSIPDTSEPPFANEKDDFGDSGGLTQTLKNAVNTMTTKIVSMARGRSKDSDADSSTDVVEAAQDLITEAENHYYYEEKAIQLNFSLLNTGEHPVDELDIEFGFPRIDDFDIADQVHMSPFDKSSHPATKNQGYPEVTKGKKGFVVRGKIRVLQPAVPTPALKCPMRMAVGPGAQLRKMAVLYTLRRGDDVIGEGRMKIKFGKVVS